MHPGVRAKRVWIQSHIFTFVDCSSTIKVIRASLFSRELPDCGVMIAKRIEINHNPMDKLFRLHKLNIYALNINMDLLKKKKDCACTTVFILCQSVGCCS